MVSAAIEEMVGRVGAMEGTTDEGVLGATEEMIDATEGTEGIRGAILLSIMQFVPS